MTVGMIELARGLVEYVRYRRRLHIIARRLLLKNGDNAYAKIITTRQRALGMRRKLLRDIELAVFDLIRSDLPFH